MKQALRAVFFLLAVSGLSAPLAIAEPAMGAIDVFNGAGSPVAVLIIASCDTPNSVANLLTNGATIATGAHKQFPVAPGCWIVSLADGQASARYNIVPGRVEHYTLIGS